MMKMNIFIIFLAFLKIEILYLENIICVQIIILYIYQKFKKKYYLDEKIIINTWIGDCNDLL